MEGNRAFELLKSLNMFVYKGNELGTKETGENSVQLLSTCPTLYDPMDSP